MLKSENITENLKEYNFIFHIGEHTTSGYLTVKIYKQNYIMELYKNIKAFVKEKNIKTKRIYKASEVKEINELLNAYIVDQEQYLTELQNLSYVNEQFINREQMTEVCTIGNNHGRIGSKSVLKFRKVEELICHYERILETLQSAENLQLIAI